MKSLLIVAHGSKRKESNDEIFDLTEKIKDKLGENFGHVSCAFLEISSPSISEGIDQCVQKNSDKILVLPYFLTTGRHVIDDIPDIVNEAKARNSNVKIILLPYLGSNSAVKNILVSIAENEK